MPLLESNLIQSRYGIKDQVISRLLLYSPEYAKFRKTVGQITAYLERPDAYASFVQIATGETELRGNLHLTLTNGADGAQVQLEHKVSNPGNQISYPTHRLDIVYDTNSTLSRIGLAVGGNDNSYPKPICKLRRTETGTWVDVTDHGTSYSKIEQFYKEGHEELNRMFNSYLIGKYPTCPNRFSGDHHGIPGQSYRDVVESLSRGQILPPKYVVTNKLELGENSAVATEITIVNAFGDPIVTISTQDLAGDTLEQLLKLAYLDRLQYISRRIFLKGLAAGTAAVAFLAACGSKPPEPTAAGVERTLTDFEWQTLKEQGAIDRFIQDLTIDIDADPILTPGTKTALYFFFASEAADGVLRQYWRKVATPDYLKNRNIFAGDDITSLFRTRCVNGGLGFYDTQSRMYVKMIPRDSVRGAYLIQSFPNWRAAWEAAQIPAEAMDQISIIGVNPGEGLGLDHREYVALASPNQGVNLESYLISLKRTLPIEEANARVAAMLEDYYLKVLLPINRQGIIQKDLQFKNIVVRQHNGTVGLVPIDLDGGVHMIDQSILTEWQYRVLAERAVIRGIQLPPFAQFIETHPLELAGITAGGGEYLPVRIRVDSMPLTVVIPQNITQGATGNNMWNIVKTIESEIRIQYKSVPQGGVIPIEINLPNGEKTVVSIVKTTSFGDPIVGYGGRMAETIKFLQKSTRFAADALLVYWLASEVDTALHPDFTVSFDSTVAFPDSAIASGKDVINLWLDGTIARLKTAKSQLADRAATVIEADDLEVKTVLGVDKLSVLRLITDYHLNQAQIADILRERAKTSLVPAPSNVRFAEPFPLLVPGATEGTTAFFSLASDKEYDLLVMYAGNDPSLSGSQLLEPVVAIFKKTGDKDYTTVPLTDKPWSVPLQIQNTQFVCRPGDELVTDGKMQLICEAVK